MTFNSLGPPPGQRSIPSYNAPPAAPPQGWVPEGGPPIEGLPDGYPPPRAPSSGSSRPAYYGYPPPTGYSRSRTTSKSSRSRPIDDSDEEISSSLGSDAASLATPPPKTPRTPLRALEEDAPLPAHSPAVYAEAPLPDGMSYPNPAAWGASVPAGRPPSVPPVSTRPPSVPPGSVRPPSVPPVNARPPSVPPVGFRPPSVPPVRPPSVASSTTTTTATYVPPPIVPIRPPSAASAARSSRTARSSGSRAAGVPLPPSVAGSESPRSAAGSLAGTERSTATARKSYMSYGSRLDSIAERPR
jgi:hypothetical protein